MGYFGGSTLFYIYSSSKKDNSISYLGYSTWAISRPSCLDLSEPPLHCI